MEKAKSYSKMSKKEKKEADAKKRITWQEMGVPDPRTKVIPDKVKEQRKNACRGKNEEE